MNDFNPHGDPGADPADAWDPPMRETAVEVLPTENDTVSTLAELDALQQGSAIARLGRPFILRSDGWSDGGLWRAAPKWLLLHGPVVVLVRRS